MGLIDSSSMKIHEYKTAFGDDTSELDENVKALLEQGFEPYGQPFFIMGERAISGRNGFYQAMVLKGD